MRWQGKSTNECWMKNTTGEVLLLCEEIAAADDGRSVAVSIQDREFRRIPRDPQTHLLQEPAGVLLEHQLSFHFSEWPLTCGGITQYRSFLSVRLLAELKRPLLSLGTPSLSRFDKISRTQDIRRVAYLGMGLVSRQQLQLQCIPLQRSCILLDLCVHHS